MPADKWIDKAELKWGRFAIPGLLRMVGCFWVLVFVLVRLNPDFLELIDIDVAKILQGEVWRCFTFAFIPRTFSLFWIIIVVSLFFMLGDGLEHEWGSFRVNLYFFSTMFCLLAGSFVVYFVFGYNTVGSGELLFHAVFFAFAVLYPNFVINLMLVLPVKVKYIAMIDAAWLLLQVMTAPLTALPIPFALIPFFAFVAPTVVRQLRHRAIAAESRMRFEANLMPEQDSFHKCYACGTTEQEDAAAEFRVAGDGEEYCVPCLDKKKEVEASQGA